jgi:hypothetical protein
MYRHDPSSPALQRTRLTPGRHGSPREGACVVELASIVAGERFSDRPLCVCPVIAGFLRGWNDRSPYADRQRLRPYAARIVGTRADARVTRERRDLCLEWAGADLRHGPVRRFLTHLRMRARIAVFCGPVEAIRLPVGAGEYAARVLFGRRDVEGGFILLDTMLALGPPPARHVDEATADGPAAPAIPVNGNGRHPVIPMPASGNGLAPREPVGAGVASARSSDA